MKNTREQKLEEVAIEIEELNVSELKEKLMQCKNISLQKTELLELFYKNEQSKIEILESEIITIKDVLHRHVLILKDMATLFGVSEEDLKYDPFEVFGTEKVKCASCGKEVEKKRNICPECVYFVHAEDLKFVSKEDISKGGAV